MFGIRNVYKLVMGNVSHPLGVVPHALMAPCKTNVPQPQSHDESMAKALIAVFGMDKDGRIAKERACNVVKQLGLVKDEEEEEGESRFDILEEELEVKEVLKVEEKNEKEQLLKQAFMVFDQDNDGYIDAKEIKRIFVCLGLDNGWDMIQIEKMIQVVDLNLDGKVDFHEFELMME